MDMESSSERDSGLRMCTDRMRIEPLACHHAQQVFAFLQERRIYEYIPEVPPPSVQALESRFGQLAAGPGPDVDQRWLNWIVFLKQSALPIGSLQATITASQAEIAYIVYPEYWRNGSAKEGVAVGPAVSAAYTHQSAPRLTGTWVSCRRRGHAGGSEGRASAQLVRGRRPDGGRLGFDADPARSIRTDPRVGSSRRIHPPDGFLTSVDDGPACGGRVGR